MVLEKAKKEQEKINKAKESRLLVITKKGEKLSTKLESGEQLRQQALETKIEKAKKQSEKISKAAQNIVLSFQKKGEQIDSKLETAEQLRKKTLDEVI